MKKRRREVDPMGKNDSLVDIAVKGLDDVAKEINKMPANMAKAVNATSREFGGSRGKGFISKAVTQEYNLSAKEVSSAFKRTHTVGKVVLSGVKLDDVRLEYAGKHLSLAHYNKSAYSPRKEAPLVENKQPKNPNSKRRVKDKRLRVPGQYMSPESPVKWATVHKKQKITIQIKKGHKKQFVGHYGTTPFIAHMGGKDKDGNNLYLPFQRASNKRGSAVSFRSASVPQMITNDKVADDIYKNIVNGLDSRLEHHIQRFNK